jgi:hypothetical protein
VSSLAVRWLGAGLLPLLVAGCPLTDDYFIEDGAGVSVLPNGGAMDEGGASSGGASAAGGSNPNGGGELPAGAGAPPSEGGAQGTCSPSTERCNGHDDDCDDVVDEQACNSMPAATLGCWGFVLSGRPDHGYMLCTGTTRDYARAQEACRAQGMRLAWLETAAENAAVAGKVDAIEAGLEAWVGASDQETEGSWAWDGEGGMRFWLGGETGNPVDDAHVAWAERTPNNSGDGSVQGEDCAVLLADDATWGDRACTIRYAYLCEEPEREFAP